MNDTQATTPHNTEPLHVTDAQLADDMRALREALAAEFMCSDWQHTGCNTVEGKAADGEWWEIAHPCPTDGTARFIGAASPARITRVLRRLEQEQESRRKRLAVAIAAAHENADPVDVVAAHRHVSRDEAVALMRAALAAQQPAVSTEQTPPTTPEQCAAELKLLSASIPPGYALVPIEPTEAMLFAAQGVLVEGADGERVSMCISEARNCYRTILAAAPAVPAASGEPAAQDKQDAERYRWLRDHAGSVFSTTPDGWRLAVVAHAPGHGIIPRTDNRELDAAVDAARAHQGGPR